MLVWQKIAKGTLLDKQGVANWLSKYNIKACDVENQVRYTNKPIECKNDCEACLNSYLDVETGKQGFNEVRDDQGNTQLRMW